MYIKTPSMINDEYKSFTIYEKLTKTKAYRAEVGDVISVSVDTFFTNSLLWRNCWIIQGWYDTRLTRKFLWWKRFPSIRKTKMVKLMYIGEINEICSNV